MQDTPLYGVGRALANTLPLVAAEAELVLLADARRPVPEVPGLESVRVVRLGVPARSPEAVWIQGAVPWWLRRWDGIFHGTFNGAPVLGSTPSVVTIHDLSFERHPEGQGWAKQRYFRAQSRATARRALRILTPTDTVRRDVVGCYPVDPDHVIVCPNAVDPVFHPRGADEVATTLALLGVRRPYVVALGGATRRGLPVAVEAWRASGACAAGVDLVVVGSERPEPAPGIRWAGRLADEEWAQVLAGADAFCYATRFEGFGMPALEAAASGTPVVCARLPALQEILGDAAEWCETPTAGALAGGLRRVIDDPARQASLADAGMARAAAAPGWEDAAAATLRAYVEAVGPA